MVFAYYNRLSPAQKRVYRRSDSVVAVDLPGDHALRRRAEQVGAALSREDRPAVQAACQELADALTSALDIPPVQVRALAARPSKSWGELHGLYTREDASSRPRITVWMRTAVRRQVVAPRTFLRTLIHELGHHLDYELLGLADSLHTEGFYKRESSLMQQIAPPR